MKISKSLSLLYSFLTALIMLSGAVAIPILWRPFYYAHIVPLKLARYTGLTVPQMEQAYGQVMDFCLGLRDDFSAGVLQWSVQGESHFADVRKLFQLDLFILGLSLLAFLMVAGYARFKKIKPHAFATHSPGFWASCGLGGALVTIGVLAALDFDRAFVVFHTLFFPGKDNWVFDPRLDPVILMLPIEFFRNCAILVLGVLLLLCTILIGIDLLQRRKNDSIS